MRFLNHRCNFFNGFFNLHDEVMCVSQWRSPFLPCYGCKLFR